MCGIAGIFGYRGVTAEPEELERMMPCLAPRGPDGEGRWRSAEGRVLLGHTRLAILDLSPSAAQPMADPETGNVLCFNGEIYNFRELRRELEAAGHTFRSESDSEVLLGAYRAWGFQGFGKLRGMYAFLFWDAPRRRLIAARDPFGIKPLYFSDDGRTVRFASQVRSLLASDAIGTEPDPAGHVGFFLWGAVPEPFTLYRSIRAVDAGGILAVSSNRGVERLGRIEGVETESRLRVPSGFRRRTHARIILAEALRDSARAHLVSDVPVGVFLSAGRDSTAVAALAAAASPDPPEALTLGIEEWRGEPFRDEAPAASEIARALGLRHRVEWVGRDRAQERLERFLASMDQPTTDGFNTFLVSALAREAGWKVALSGLGGDELFGGYPSFRQVPRMVGLARLAARVPGGPALVRALVGRLASAGSEKTAHLLDWAQDLSGAYFLRRALFLPPWLEGAWEQEFLVAGLERLGVLETLEEILKRAGNPPARQAVRWLETSMYMRNQLLRDTDWTSLSQGLEVRVPFVDQPLWQALRQIEAAGVRLSKADLLAAAGTATLPGQRRRPKTGFGLPLAEWFREPWQRFGPPDTRARGLRPWAVWVYEQYPGGAGNAPWLGWRTARA